MTSSLWDDVAICTWNSVVNIVKLIFYHNNAVFILLLRLTLWGRHFYLSHPRVQCTLMVHACCLMYCFIAHMGAAILIYSTHLSTLRVHPQGVSYYTLKYPCTPVHPKYILVLVTDWLQISRDNPGCSLYIIAHMRWKLVLIMKLCLNWPQPLDHNHDHLTTKIWWEKMAGKFRVCALPGPLVSAYTTQTPSYT